jgi:NitT/TauT family transport system ATP-binding protein
VSHSGSLSLAQATKSYPTAAGQIAVFRRLDLDIAPGEVLCLMGPSGCGKSTLLRILAGLERLDEGIASFDGGPIEGPDPRRSLVFQDFALFPWLSVADNVAFGPRARGRVEDLERRVADLLELVGLSGFERATPRSLSGGMAQRVALARALANDPEVLLLDEPLGALDVQTRLELQDAVARILRASGVTALVVTHDFDEAVVLADRVVVLGPRPARVVREVAVTLPRPRDRASLEFERVRARVVAATSEAFTRGRAA